MESNPPYIQSSFDTETSYSSIHEACYPDRGIYNLSPYSLRFLENASKSLRGKPPPVLPTLLSLYLQCTGKLHKVYSLVWADIENNALSLFAVDFMLTLGKCIIICVYLLTKYE